MAQVSSLNPNVPDVWEAELHLCHAPKIHFFAARKSTVLWSEIKAETTYCYSADTSRIRWHIQGIVFYGHVAAFCSPQENKQFAHCFAMCSKALRGMIIDKMVITGGVQLCFLASACQVWGSWLSTVQARSGQRADLVIFLYIEWKYPKGSCNLKPAQVVWHIMWYNLHINSIAHEMQNKGHAIV